MCELDVNTDALSFLPEISLLGSAFSFVHTTRCLFSSWIESNLELENSVGPRSTKTHPGFLKENNITGKNISNF